MNTALTHSPFTAWSELFEEVKYWDNETRRKENPRRDWSYHGFTISPYCMITRVTDGTTHVGALHVKPTQAVMDYIERNMIVVNHDAIYFKVIMFEDGGGVVYAEYNQIIGSRKLGTVANVDVERALLEARP